MGSKLDLILSKLSAPSGPALSPPIRRPVPKGLPSGFRVEEDIEDDAGSGFDPWASSSNIGDPVGGSSMSLSRRASRRIWVTGLDEVCPDVPVVSTVPPPRQTPHFKLMKQKKEEDLMPFLPEVSQQCLEASLVEALPPLRNIEKFYKTSISEEKQLLNIRHVPKCLAAQVPEKSLQAPGLSEQQNRLQAKSKWGLKERLALESHRQSCAYLRLTNNFQLALSLLEKQLDDCKLQVELLNSRSFNDAEDREGVMEVTDSLMHRFNVMSLAVTDASYTNVDFLKTASYQYGKSLKDRADSWIQSTTLPAPVKQGLLKVDLATPVEDATQPLHIISLDAQKVITDFAQDKRQRLDMQVVQKVLNKPSTGAKPKAPQHKKKQQQPQSSSPSWQEFQQWQREQSSWGGQGARGRGGNNQGKGQFKGNKSGKQPFPKGGKGGKNQ
jgi:hypothetical protein